LALEKVWHKQDMKLKLVIGYGIPKNDISANEPGISATEPYVSATEPY